MVGITKRHRQRVKKNARSFFKSNAVLSCVSPRLRGIPLKNHKAILAVLSSRGNGRIFDWPLCYNFVVPIYEYLCEDCKTTYEKIVLSKNDDVNCPKCGSGRHALQLSTFSTPRNGGAASSAPDRENFTCAGNPSACGCGPKN